MIRLAPALLALAHRAVRVLRELEGVAQELAQSIASAPLCLELGAPGRQPLALGAQLFDRAPLARQVVAHHARVRLAQLRRRHGRVTG